MSVSSHSICGRIYFPQPNPTIIYGFLGTRPTPLSRAGVYSPLSDSRQDFVTALVH